MLDEDGVHGIEAGMPAVSKEDKDANEAFANEGLNAMIFCFPRCRYQKSFSFFASFRKLEN